ncbi:FtsH protease activity modulator HflK [Mycetohabitans sp. B5]|uniref:Protein HflK n=1 Tax=Mycetohabitans endofungorum TaxID=417203 RepID=A0A2P5KBJ1_9BURK|nr:MULTISPECIES: FtsH protease activity modulator HflK [Mycetohabitans]MCG1054380.1 FtsH protease activity modulator HflK [Mycetohabitans sp. B5]PPB84089.1 protease FtsH subunit HflK [Mycetohabitans endofungorum]
MVNDKHIRSTWQRARAVFSINDPRWGRGQGGDDASRRPQDQRNNGKDGQEGPPDLDELWRDFNRRINRLFGRKGGDGGSPGPANLSNGRGGHLGLGIVVGVLVAIYLASGVYIVQEGQAGVVLQFGKYKYTTGSGIQWRLPYPFQSNEIVNMSQVRSVEIGRDNMIRSTNLKDMSMLTKDENIIDVRFAVQYRVKDPAAFLFNNVDAEGTVTQAAETAVREIVGKNTMDYVLYEGREQVALQLSQQIQRILDQYKTGIIVSSVTMQSVQPPQQVQSAFDDAVKAGQDRERAKNEALAYANNVVPLAQGTAARMVADAHGYRARVVAQAEGDAARFKQVQAEYAKAPAVTRERMYLDTMQQIYSNATKVIVDSKASSNLLYLPLDKVMAQHRARPQVGASPGATDNGVQGGASPAGSSAGGPAVPAQAMPGASVGDDASRSRDLFRSRGRDDGQ